MSAALIGAILGGLLASSDNAGGTGCLLGAIGGLLLMILAIILFILEIKVTSYGMLSVAGAIALFLGAIMLFDESDYGMRL